jgi:putative exporter of polyketide antibiotics
LVNLLDPPLLGTLVLLGAGLTPATDSPSWVPSSSSSESKAPANILFLSSVSSMFAGDAPRWLRLSLMMLLVLAVLLWLRPMLSISNSILYHVLDLLRVVFVCP